MGIVKLSESVFFEKTEFASCQKEAINNDPSPSGSCSYYNFEGSVITLKNGRKIFVRMEPKEVLKIIEDTP